MDNIIIINKYIIIIINITIICTIIVYTLTNIRLSNKK